MKVTQLLARKDGLKDHDATFAKNRVHLIGVPPPALNDTDKGLLWQIKLKWEPIGYFT